MSPDDLPEGTDTVIEPGISDTDIDTSGAAPMDSGAAADAEAAGSDPGVPAFDSEAGGADADGGATDQGGPADAAAGPASARETFRDAKDKAGQKAQDLRGQATDKLRAYAVGGKDKATETIQGFARMIDDAAAQVDDKVGAQYGDYARKAAQTLAGLASTIEEQDVDELFDQARDAVRKSPGIAVGAAAALGFVLARVVKAGVGGDTTVEKDVAFTPDPSLGGKGRG